MTRTELEQQLITLQRRVAQLEGRAEHRPPWRIGTRSAVLGLAAAMATVLVLVTTGAAIAADGACPNGLPFCFIGDTPAKASEVNHNFAQLKEWTEQKVGTVGTADVTVTGDVSVDGTITSTNADNVGTAIGGGIILQEGGATMRLDGNEIEADSDALHLNWNADLPVRVGGDLEVTKEVSSESLSVTNGLPISFEGESDGYMANGGDPVEVNLGSVTRRVCFLMGMQIHDNMANESLADCRVRSHDGNWYLYYNADNGSGDPDLHCWARCLTW
jgi:hypothetical protein